MDDRALVPPVGEAARAGTKGEAEWVGKYMIRPLVSLERLAFLEPEGKVGYRLGRDGEEQEMMDYLEFTALVTSHIPGRGQVMIRSYGLYANAHRWKVKKAGVNSQALRMIKEKFRPIPSKGWAALIRKPHEGLRSAAMIRRSTRSTRCAALTWRPRGKTSSRPDGRVSLEGSAAARGGAVDAVSLPVFAGVPPGGAPGRTNPPAGLPAPAGGRFRSIGRRGRRT